MHNTPPITSRALQLIRRERCPHRPVCTAPRKNTVIARSGATWQSVFPSRRVRSLCFRRRRRLPTVVPTDSRPLSWPPIGALPRNRLASPATGGASPISPTPRLHRTPCPAPVGRGALTPPHDMHRTASQKLSLRGAKRRGNPYSPNTKNRPANPAGRSHFLRNMYSLSCPCDAATPAPDPSRTSASCSPPPARHSGGTAHSTSQR